MTWLPYPSWLNAGDNAWQMTAATFVGLMSLPGLAVLYGGVMQKRWSVNSMMLTFVAFCLTLIAWCCGPSRWASATRSRTAGRASSVRKASSGRSSVNRAACSGMSVRRARRSSRRSPTGPPFHFPEASLVYFQFVFAAITPILALGSVLGRVNFKAWIPYVLAVDHVRVHGQRVPDLGRWLLRGARRPRLLRWLRDPPRGRHLRVRVRGGDRSAIAARSRDRRAQQPVDGRVRRGSAVARMERLQRRGLLLRRR